MPWNTKDFAPSIWHKMYVNSLRTVQSAYSRLLDEDDSELFDGYLMMNDDLMM